VSLCIVDSDFRTIDSSSAYFLSYGGPSNNHGKGVFDTSQARGDASLDCSILNTRFTWRFDCRARRSASIRQSI
jgi:hypothetical protein